MWQLWVNLALANEEAARRDAADARFAVLVSSNNTALRAASHVDELKGLLRRPQAASLIDLEHLIAHLVRVVPPSLDDWANSLTARYGAI